MFTNRIIASLFSVSSAVSNDYSLDHEESTTARPKNKVLHESWHTSVAPWSK
uniref:Uncharacterized protein n=1 Tax=Arundo donax TaxID=35708 RepID=A0A0A9AJI6_ARUDO